MSDAADQQPAASPRSQRPALHYWLTDHDTTPKEFAERHGFLKQEVSVWCLPWDHPGRREPTDEKAARILEATGRVIGADSFIHPDLRGMGAPASAPLPDGERRPLAFTPVRETAP